MKSQFNKNWNASKQPRKQRKFLANAPIHIKRKQLATTLDKPLREKYNRRSIEIRKDDEVKIMRGKFAGKQGKVMEVNVAKSKIQIDGITITKKDGEKVLVWLHPSNTKIIKLEEKDERRMKKTKKIDQKKEEKVVSPKVKENQAKQDKEKK